MGKRFLFYSQKIDFFTRVVTRYIRDFFEAEFVQIFQSFSVSVILF